ncbi:MAG: zinc ribbon domain-containing protein [Anaerolineales bacterium]|nr:zinc ribbon domain-containing protein [Anaerolineales bacterium]
MTILTVRLAQDSTGSARRAAPRCSRLAALLAVLLLAGAALGPARPAAAQAPLSLDRLLISLWPEFDRAGVLVILDGTLPAETTLPAQVTLRMPAAAGQPSATAYTAADGSLLAAVFTTTPAGNDIIVTLTTETLQFRLEYYDPALSLTGRQRAYTFDWTSDYTITAAAVRLQQPAGASALTTTPALTAVGAGEFGLQYYEGGLGALAGGQRVQLTVAYTKADDTLSSVAVGAADAGSAAVNVSSSAAANLTLVWLALGGVGVLAVGVTGLILVQRRAQAGAVHRRAPRRHRPSPGGGQRRPLERRPQGERLSTERFTAAERRSFTERQAAARDETPPKPKAERPPAAPGAAFCTQCGGKLRPGDKFCRQCGAPVRAAGN